MYLYLWFRDQKYYSVIYFYKTQLGHCKDALIKGIS